MCSFGSLQTARWSTSRRLGRHCPLGILNGYDPECMKNMSNDQRIARAAEEARVEASEKVVKKAAKPRSKTPAKDVRMKIVWEVCGAAGTAVQTFSYPDRPAAESATLELTKTSGRPHTLRATKVPME